MADEICKNKLDINISLRCFFGKEFLRVPGIGCWHTGLAHDGDLEDSSHSIAALLPHHGAPSLPCR